MPFLLLYKIKSKPKTDMRRAAGTIFLADGDITFIVVM